MPTVNTSVYGLSENWTYVGLSEKSPAFADFGDSPVPEGKPANHTLDGTFSTAYLNKKLIFNEKIDNSICAIGVDSGYSGRKMTYYPVLTNEYTTPQTLYGEQAIPLFWNIYDNSSIYNSYYNVIGFQSTTLKNQNAWGIDSVPATVTSTSMIRLNNQDAGIKPCVYMPVKDCMWLIFVLCSIESDYNTSIPTPVTIDLYSYVHGTDTDGIKLYEKYPVICGIGLNLAIKLRSDNRVMMDWSIGNCFSPNPEIFKYGTEDNEQKEMLMYRNPAFHRTNSTFIGTNSEDKADNVNTLISPMLFYGNYAHRIQTSNTKNMWYGVLGSPQVIDLENGWGQVQYTPYIEWGSIDEFESFCKSQAAYQGMFFTDKYYIAINETEFDSDDVYLGIIDDAGITHGQYSQGQDNRNQKQWNWNDLISESPYDPSKKPDPSQYDEETKLYGATSAGTAFLHVYECDGAVIENLKYYLYQIVAPEATNETLTKNFLTVNPIDCITGCYEFPFTIRDRFSGPSNIVLGNTHASGGEDHPIVGYILTQTLRILDFGSVYYYPFYDDFRDYEPYSEALLYIPYVGYIPISPSEFMGHNIGLKMICDLLTGSCQALVYKDGLVIESSSGNIGTQVPITGIQQADYSNSIHSASTRLLASQVSSVASFGNSLASLATGNVVGAVSSIANVAQAGINVSNAKYELEHTKVPFKQSGVASPNVNFSNEQQARLILKRPQMLESYNPAQYAHTVGFACLITAPLSTFTGFTQATNVDLSGITATVTEKQMIQQQLQSGVYL